MRIDDVSLVAIDVDGTLLDSRHRLAPVTADAIREAQEAGRVRVTLATGKIFPSIEGLVAKLRICTPLILSNGALLQHPSGEIIYQSTLDVDLVHEIAQLGYQLDADLALYTADAIYVQHLNDNVALVVEYGEPVPKVLEEWQGSPRLYQAVCKILLINRYSSATVTVIQAQLERFLSDRANVHRSLPTMVEVTARRTNKAAALLKLAQHLNIPMQRVVAIGDSYNDVSMFEVAGYAVAMGNAPDLVKAAAGAVLESNDDHGVALFLQRLMHNGGEHQRAEKI